MNLNELIERLKELQLGGNGDLEVLFEGCCGSLNSVHYIRRDENTIKVSEFSRE